ncbi:caspase family protein [Ruegeria arenilitoris]|uniref:caspase family protein n=1 Tax=Ruegeria arenilitoris TaxID=1173585 RepID=UPI00147B6889|nr:caspase family protein [Ruegeria arenilitoris]
MSQWAIFSAFFPRLLLFALICFLAAYDNAAAEPEKRVALVIGNSAYQHVSSLPNPSNDAEDISRSLERIGFQVTRGQDLDYNGMRIALRDFAEVAANADVALVYFAGHGIEIENTNYLIPVSATLKSDRDVEFEAIRLDAIVGSISDTAGLKIVLVDACRNNPFVAQMARASSTRSIGRGLAAVEPGGVIVGYAARGGTLAQDGDGRNSPYAKAILEHIEQPGLELGKMFRRVRDRVFELTDGFQEPFIYGSLPGEDIYLVPKSEPVAMQLPSNQVSNAPISEAAPTKTEDVIAAAMKTNTMRGWDLIRQKYRSVPVSEPEVLKRMTEITPDWAKERGLLLALEDTLIPGRERKKQLQDNLNDAGFDVGASDGALGPKSRSGIKELQAAHGLEQTGYADPAVLTILGMGTFQQGEDSFISNPFAVRQNAEDLDLLGESEEITRILKCLGLRQSIYGKFRGNLYVVMVYSGNLFGARNEAQKCGVDLASITSAEENAFVVRMMANDPSFFSVGYDSKTNVSYKAGPYFGFRKDPKEDNAVIGWRWYSGEPVKYTNWLPSKPNRTHGNGNKAYAQFQYEARGRRDLSNVVPTKWFDGSGGYVRSVVLKGSLQ